MKQFQGRVICPGTCEAEALVSHGGFNTLASYQMALMFHDKQVKCGDQNNPDLYKKPMIGKALCLPETIGSTTGGMVLYTACASGQQPACMLFSKHIDSLAASGAILASVWTDADMPVIDCLGDEFLAAVQTGPREHMKSVCRPQAARLSAGKPHGFPTISAGSPSGDPVLFFYSSERSCVCAAPPSSVTGCTGSPH